MGKAAVPKRVAWILGHLDCASGTNSGEGPTVRIRFPQRRVSVKLDDPVGVSGHHQSFHACRLGLLNDSQAEFRQQLLALVAGHHATAVATVSEPPTYFWLRFRTC